MALALSVNQDTKGAPQVGIVRLLSILQLPYFSSYQFPNLY